MPHRFDRTRGRRSSYHASDRGHPQYFDGSSNADSAAFNTRRGSLPVTTDYPDNRGNHSSSTGYYTYAHRDGISPDGNTSWGYWQSPHSPHSRRPRIDSDTHHGVGSYGYDGRFRDYESRQRRFAGHQAGFTGLYNHPYLMDNASYQSNPYYIPSTGLANQVYNDVYPYPSTGYYTDPSAGYYNYPSADYYTYPSAGYYTEPQISSCSVVTYTYTANPVRDDRYAHVR